MLTFFEGLHGNSPTCTPEDVTNADRLHTAIVKSCTHAIGWSRKAWAREVQLLNSEVGAQRMLPILDWYCNNIGKPYVPVALCAKTFRKKFPQLELAYQRLTKNQFIISPLALELTEQLKTYSWGSGQLCQLPQAVQLSLNNHQATQKRNLVLLNSSSNISPRYRTIQEIVTSLTYYLSKPYGFTISWFQKMNKKVKDWLSWSGNMMKLAFALPCKEIEAIVRQASQRFSQRQDAANYFLDRLYAQ